MNERFKDLLDKAEALDLDKKKNNGKRKSSKVLNYVITENDEQSDLLVLTKNMINEAEITYEDVYNVHGKDVGNNMIQSLKKSQLSWKRFCMWAEVCGLKPEILLKPIE